MGNSIGSRLKQFGLDLLKGATMVNGVVAQVMGIEPIIKAFVPQTQAVQSVETRVDVGLKDILNITKLAEGAKVLGGADSAGAGRFASGLLTQALSAAGHFDGHKVEDEAMLNEAIQDFINAAVKFDNAFKPKN